MDLFLAKAIIEGINSEFIKSAERFGKEIARNVTTTKIRDIFGTVRKLQQSIKDEDEESEITFNLDELLMLKPRLAYLNQRHHKDLEKLKEQLDPAIDKVVAGNSIKERVERFRRFCQGFEAIIAYHRASGGH